MAELIKVSAQSRSTAVAGAIAGVMREHGYAEVQAIGASAVNQAIKAIAIARGYLEQDQIDLAIVPSFTEVDIDGNERTAVRLAVFKRPATLTTTVTPSRWDARPAYLKRCRKREDHAKREGESRRPSPSLVVCAAYNGRRR